jgi:hypothetical protein
LDESLKGDTTTLCSPDQHSSSKKKRVSDDSNMQQLVEQGNKMLKMMAETADDQKKFTDSWELLEQNKEKRAAFMARIEIAKALGDKDELKDLMSKAKENKICLLKYKLLFI